VSGGTEASGNSKKIFQKISQHAAEILARK
jgi:hypothetical protein